MLEIQSDVDHICAALAEIVGETHVLRGADMAPWTSDWTGQYKATPMAVVRPASTAEISAVMKLAFARKIPVVPAAGNTGLTGGTHAEGMLVLSVERLSKIRDINVDARVATVEAGVVVDVIDAAAEAHELSFPLKFGASGSARIGGALATNAGGANVLRYGTARALCLGIEAVLPNGDVLDLLPALRKDNTGFDLRNLLIGSEGQLGIITAASLALVPRPKSHFTALLALEDLAVAPALLLAFQDASGGLVEAFEYMNESYLACVQDHAPDILVPFEATPRNAILLEIASPAAELPSAPFETVLEKAFEDGWISDAIIAQSEAQRQRMWDMREISAELIFAHPHAIDTDVAVPLDKISDYLEHVRADLQQIDPDCVELTVGHLGDGNLHVALHPSASNPDDLNRLREAIDARAVAFGGTFSAEHGIGLTKRHTMAQHKPQAQLGAMKAIKAALDPHHILNPGKMLP